MKGDPIPIYDDALKLSASKCEHGCPTYAQEESWQRKGEDRDYNVQYSRRHVVLEFIL